MNKHNLIIISSMLAMSILSFFIIICFYAPSLTKHYDCRASFVIENYGYKMPVVATLRTNGHSGFIFYDGPVYFDNKLAGHLNRQVDFTIDYQEETVYMENKKIHKFSKDNLLQNQAEKILPDFFVKPDSSIYLDVSPYKNGTFFIRDNIPLFWCKNI